jgi:hypothetical protein
MTTARNKEIARLKLAKMNVPKTARPLPVGLATPTHTVIQEPTKKPRLPHGFLTRKGSPTQNAVSMFLVYLSYLPKGWHDRTKQVSPFALRKVRLYFKWDVEHGFEVMIRWGMDVSCGHSYTSDTCLDAMEKAYNEAKGLLGKGYNLSTVRLK